MVSEFYVSDFGFLLGHPDSISSVQPRVDRYPVIRLRLRALHPPTTRCPVCPHRFKINGGGDDLDFGQGKLRALSEDLPVESDHAGAIVVQAVPVASLLIRIKVDTTELNTIKRFIQIRCITYFSRRLFNRVHPLIELP